MHKPRGPSSPHRFTFVLEQKGGHVTHYQNLRAVIDVDPSVQASWYPIRLSRNRALEARTAYDSNDAFFSGTAVAGPQVSRASRRGAIPAGRLAWQAVKSLSRPYLPELHATVASLRARRLLMDTGAGASSDALFFFTQATALLSVGLMKRVPAVISLDATPRDFDALRTLYGFHRGNPVAQALMHALYRRSFRAARGFAAFSDWVKRSLVSDYGIASERIKVIPPGVDLDLWPKPASRHNAAGPVRLLFVGGDFARKGGHQLLQVFRTSLRERCELHIVTWEPVEAGPGIHVYHDIAPDSPLLRQLYTTADLFVLPTLADCHSWASIEAMACGLPVISCPVGGIPEAVLHEQTGLLVPPGDVRALGAAIDALASDPARREAMGIRGRALVEQKFNAAANARSILEMMSTLAETKGARL